MEIMMNPLIAEPILTIPNVLFVVFAIGTIYGVYNHFNKPREDSRVNDAVTGEQLGSKATVLAQKEVENKATLLDQSVRTEKEYNTKKFEDMNERFNKTDSKIDTIGEGIHDMNLALNIKLTRVATVIEEHMKITT